MLAKDQSAVIAYLEKALRRGTDPVSIIHTHISIIFLSGDRAYKMKRAVTLPYVDFSSVEARVEACRKELQYNSITAPETYLAVRLVTDEGPGRYAIDGRGHVCEALVEMVRFDQKLLLDNLARNGALTSSLMHNLACSISRYHRGLTPVHITSGREAVSKVIEINRAGFATSSVFRVDEVSELTAAFSRRLSQFGGLLDEREQAGKVCRCHGDLHLRNIFLYEGEPRLFDCIEFNDELATSDILYDLAFLIMDLWHRNEREQANRLMNRYLDETDDEEGFPLLAFFVALRAAVRAHVLATQSIDASADQGRALIDEARTYFTLARSSLESALQQLIAIGGLSGTGKSTLAEAVAPLVGAVPGARIMESDRIRKRMHGVPPETQLPARAYLPEISAKVYLEMAWRSRLILKSGGCVIADAVFDKLRHRAMFEDIAVRGRIAFRGIWLEADPALLRKRVAARPHGVSDADVGVLEKQLQHDLSDVSWPRLDASASIDTLANQVIGVPTTPILAFDPSV